MRTWLPFNYFEMLPKDFRGTVVFSVWFLVFGA